jgi:predicted MFS family arabinose efflux permease
MPLHSTLALSLAPRERSGRVMGTLGSVSALAAIVGMGTVALVGRLAGGVSLRAYFVLAGVMMVGAAMLLWRLPPRLGSTQVAPRRLLVSRRYWRYYALTFFEGSRKQVLGAFAALVLVQTFRLAAWQISLLLLASAVVNFAAAPGLGRALDRWGERTTLGISYLLLIGTCVAYATARQVWLLGILFVAIKLLVVLEMGLATYVNRIAPREELTPTLSAGISVNHITSVAMPLLAGILYPVIGYRGIFLGAAGMIALSLPFVLTLKAAPATGHAPEAAPAQ